MLLGHMAPIDVFCTKVCIYVYTYMYNHTLYTHAHTRVHTHTHTYIVSVGQRLLTTVGNLCASLISNG